MKSEKSDGFRPHVIRPGPSDSISSEKTVNNNNLTTQSTAKIGSSFYKQTGVLQPESLAKSLHIPISKQSLAALSFALHLKLPLTKESIEPLIKQSLVLPPHLQEAGLLGILLAFSKGIYLSKTAVEQLAQLLHPHQEPTDKSKVLHKTEAALHQPEEEGKTADDPSASEPDEQIPLEAGDAAHLFLETVKKHPVLDLLNRLSGKNRQRHLILPFNFKEDSCSIKGSLRLLCNELPGGSLEVTSLSLEAVSPNHEWFVQAAKNKAGGLAIRIQVYPEPKDPKAIVNSLSSISDTVSIGFEKPDTFQDFKKETYSSFEIKA